MAELQRAEITARIRQARMEAGLTQPEMAQLLDVGQRAYQNYESERVPWDLMGRIADVTGRSLRWLLHGEDEDEPSMEVMQRLAAIQQRLDSLASGQGPTTYAELVELGEQQRTLTTAIAELTEVMRRCVPPDDMTA